MNFSVFRFMHNRATPDRVTSNLMGTFFNGDNWISGLQASWTAGDYEQLASGEFTCSGFTSEQVLKAVCGYLASTHRYALSVGDIVGIGDEYFAACGTGFKQILLPYVNASVN